MPNRAIYLLVVEGFADWEPAHAVAELRRHGGYRVETIGLDRNPVISMGGLRITPSRTIDELDINDVAAFILPGGDRWENMRMEAVGCAQGSNRGHLRCDRSDLADRPLAWPPTYK